MTLFEFYKKFDTNEKCFDYLVKLRWPDGVNCYHCGHQKVYKITNTDSPATIPYMFKCAKCKYKISVKAQTVFNSSNIPLWQFFYLIYSSCINRKNISSCQNATNLGIGQKACWYIMAKVRRLCWQDDNLTLTGNVEVDETYLRMAKWKRPTSRGMSKSQPYKKLPILGLIQRGGKVIIKHIPKKDKKSVQDVVLKYVETGSRLITDSAACYFNMSSYYKHEIINHKQGEYVRGDVHTNSIEAVWNSLKKAISSTHNGVSQPHIQSYCDELVYRYNNRDKPPVEKFEELIMRGCAIGCVGQKKVSLGVDKASKKKNKKYIATDLMLCGTK